MTVGSLLQYKEQFYGRFYPKLPEIPFEQHQFLPSIHQNVFRLPIPVNGVLPTPKETARKKYVLFCSQVVRVEHRKFSSVGCNYLKCFISDPYLDGDTTEGWLREEWIEPLNELPTYYDENMKLIQEKIQAIEKRGSHKPSLESQEFQNWLSDVRWGRKAWRDS